MRAALAPTSPTPTRETERTSIRLPASVGADPDHDVVGEAEPEGPIGRLDPAAAGVLGDDLPSPAPGAAASAASNAALRRRPRPVERRDVGIGLALLRRDRRRRRSRRDSAHRRAAAGSPRTPADPSGSVVMSWIGGTDARGVQLARRHADRDQADGQARRARGTCRAGGRAKRRQDQAHRRDRRGRRCRRRPRSGGARSRCRTTTGRSGGRARRSASASAAPAMARARGPSAAP